MFPRAMNNTEKSNLKLIKDSGLSYELRYNYSKYSGGYMVNIPALKETHCLNNTHYKGIK